MAEPSPALPRVSANGSSSNRRNAFVDWKLACSAPVWTSPVSWVRAFTICGRDKPRRFENCVGNVTLASIAASIAPAIWTTSAGREAGGEPGKKGNWLMMRSVNLQWSQR